VLYRLLGRVCVLPDNYGVLQLDYRVGADDYIALGKGDMSI
jgi:hypothetical protein